MAILLFSTHFRSFPIIPVVRTLTLAWIPAFAGMTGGGRLLDPFGPVWHRLLLAGRLEMGPRWPRLALRSLVRGGLAGPGCGPGWPRYEWPGVAKPLIQLHLVAFRCFPVVYAGTRGGVQEWPTFNSVSFGLIPSHFSRRLGPRFHPHPSLLPSREKGSDRLHGNDGGWG